jgi:hypothetical protein
MRDLSIGRENRTKNGVFLGCWTGRDLRWWLLPRNPTMSGARVRRVDRPFLAKSVDFSFLPLQGTDLFFHCRRRLESRATQLPIGWAGLACWCVADPSCGGRARRISPFMPCSLTPREPGGIIASLPGRDPRVTYRCLGCAWLNVSIASHDGSSGLGKEGGNKSMPPKSSPGDT